MSFVTSVMIKEAFSTMPSNLYVFGAQLQMHNKTKFQSNLGRGRVAGAAFPYTLECAVLHFTTNSISREGSEPNHNTSFLGPTPTHHLNGISIESTVFPEFTVVTNNSTHTLHKLLPPQSTASQHYHLRRCTHDRQLPTQTSHLCNKNFVTRALYKDCY